MKRVIGLVVLLLVVTAPAWAQRFSTYEALTVDNTSGGVALAAATLTSNGQQMNYCEGRLETAQIRFTDNGTAPTSSVGTLVEVGDLWVAYSNATAKATRFIRTGTASGSLRVRCYDRGPR